MNIEYVYLILTGIEKHLKSGDLNDSQISISVKELKFNNLEQWDITNSVVTEINKTFDDDN